MRLPPVPGRSRPAFPRPCAARGFTLVEVVLAVSTGVLLVAMLFSLYLMLSRTVDDRQARQRGEGQILLALDQLHRDLTGALPVTGYEESGFTLQTEGPAGVSSSVATFVTVRPEPGAPAGSAWSELVRVGYRLDTAPAARGHLLRTEQPLTGPGALDPPVASVLARGVSGFRLQVWVNEDWVEEWTALPGTDNVWPRAARVTIEPDPDAPGGAARTLDVLIPAGWVIVPEPVAPD
jgi:type II secretion system protein J